MFGAFISELMFNIVKEYSQNLGLNMPPCVQQELNALAQFVNTYSIKDVKVEVVDGKLVFTATPFNGAIKQTEIELPTAITAEQVLDLIEPGRGVVVDLSEDGKHIEIHADTADVVMQPIMPLYKNAVYGNGENGAQTMFELGEGLSVEDGVLKAGGGSSDNPFYLHKIDFTFTSDDDYSTQSSMIIITDSNTIGGYADLTESNQNILGSTFYETLFNANTFVSLRLNNRFIYFVANSANDFYDYTVTAGQEVYLFVKAYRNDMSGMYTPAQQTVIVKIDTIDRHEVVKL